MRPTHNYNNLLKRFADLWEYAGTVGYGIWLAFVVGRPRSNVNSEKHSACVALNLHLLPNTIMPPVILPNACRRDIRIVLKHDDGILL